MFKEWHLFVMFYPQQGKKHREFRILEGLTKFDLRILNARLFYVFGHNLLLHANIFQRLNFKYVNSYFHSSEIIDRLISLDAWSTTSKLKWMRLYLSSRSPSILSIIYTDEIELLKFIVHIPTDHGLCHESYQYLSDLLSFSKEIGITNSVLFVTSYSYSHH